jgi:uncharacterized protein (DUF433 family)
LLTSRPKGAILSKMTEHPRIEIDPRVMGGKPVIRGTRVTVEQVLRECARGATAAEIADQYPRLTAEDVAAALGFAADYMARETVAAAE